MKAIVQHLRFPFSLLLMPVFLFTLVVHQGLVFEWRTWLCFFILHFLVYPSSNAFNSLQDKDEGSIGLIENPMQVPMSMGIISIGFDCLAIGLAAMINAKTALMIAVYILASRLYSWRTVRLKQYAIIGFLTVFVFQGCWIYFIVSQLSSNFNFTTMELLNAFACSCLIGSGYPLSQIYQHVQDKKDGVHTISMLLGYQYTFIFSGILFAFAALVFVVQFYASISEIIIFGISALLVGAYFTYWMAKVSKATKYADFKHTMTMNGLSCIAFNICFIIILIIRISIGFY
jgi:1,4-dihydroxy-2-naphthoate polyprenyltransferase